MKNRIINLKPKTLIFMLFTTNRDQYMKRLSTLQLIPGMIIARNVYSFGQEQILPQGTVLTDKLIAKLDLYGILTVYVEDNVPLSSDPSSAPREPSYSERIKNSAEFKQFKQNYDNNVHSFRNAINNVVERNIKLDIPTLLGNTLSMVYHNSGHISILDMLQNMRTYDDSTFIHSMNVALIGNLLATWLKFSKDEIELVTACGLFHDIGKILIPRDIITKPGRLSKAEYEQIKKHPAAGYQLLLTQDVDKYVCNTALTHHERCDGTGYPLQLQGNEIHKYARIVAIADVYDAMTAARCYRGPMCPFHVIEIFEAEGFQKYDVEYLLTFMENVVNSYIRSRCRLSDGREGDIIYINKEKLSRPIIQCGTDYINLAETPALSIAEIL